MPHDLGATEGMRFVVECVAHVVDVAAVLDASDPEKLSPAAAVVRERIDYAIQALRLGGYNVTVRLKNVRFEPAKFERVLKGSKCEFTVTEEEVLVKSTI
jgi:hypothetical protein